MKTHDAHAIVVLGKEPLPGRVKTRLAKDIGNGHAAQVQQVLAWHMFQELTVLPYPIVLQLQGSLTGDFGVQCRQLGVEVEEQVSGTLTEKIFYASRRAHRTLVLGMDMPCIDPRELRRAMDDDGIILGPSKDGGYWIIGGTNLPPEILTDIPWSTDKVWQSTVDKCTQLELEYKVLSCQQDIDTLSDLSDLLSNPQCPPSLRNDLLQILPQLGVPHA